MQIIFSAKNIVKVIAQQVSKKTSVFSYIIE